MNLTRRQRELLDFLRQFIQERRYAPSIKEIGQALGLRSTATVHKHLRNLEERGAIRRDWNRSRSIELLPDDSEERPVSLPIVAELRAGQPMLELEQGHSVSVPLVLAGAGRSHALRVRGEGFAEQQLCPGDILLVNEQRLLEPGATVVALLEDDVARVCRVEQGSAGVELSGLGPVARRGAAGPRVYAVVTGLLRRY